MTHRSVSSLLAAVFARPAPELCVPLPALHVDAVDDVEELLHHGHLLEHELDLAVQTLPTVCNEKEETESNELTTTGRQTKENIYFSGRFISLRNVGIIATATGSYQSHRTEQGKCFKSSEVNFENINDPTQPPCASQT